MKNANCRVYTTTRPDLFETEEFYQDPYLSEIHEKYKKSRTLLWKLLKDLGNKGLASTNKRFEDQVRILLNKFMAGWDDSFLTVSENESWIDTSCKPADEHKRYKNGGGRSDAFGRVRRSPRGN